MFCNASAGSFAKIGDEYYESIEEAIANASSTDTITLVSDVKLEALFNPESPELVSIKGIALLLGICCCCK